MAMNFFQHQDRARRRTWLLVLFFALAVILIVVAINAAAFLIFTFAIDPMPLAGLGGRAQGWLDRPWWLVITLSTALVMLGASGLNLLRLRGGGRAVAEMVRARRIDFATADPQEHKLVNVVEEMSIASGTPVPALYVMDQERGINAFVAGFQPTEAVMVVTRGAIDQLDRDELQGVVAHEFSHILNGDMRVNLRLLGVLAGILVIGQLGGFLLRSVRLSERRSSSSKEGGSPVVALLLLGLALFVIGYVGLFFGRMIKTAISRQRELLADASAVQFTRNSSGIAGALWKIHEASGGSALVSRHAEDMSHMCFGESLHFARLFATHPPIEERIRAIEPRFRARMRARRRRRPTGTDTSVPTGTPAAGSAEVRTPAPRNGGISAFAAPDVFGEPGTASLVTPQGLVESVGNPAPAHVRYARALHARLPQALLDAARSPDIAASIPYALLLAYSGEGGHSSARHALARLQGKKTAREASELAARIAKLGAQSRLALLDIALPALGQLDTQARRGVLETVQAMVEADGQVTLFEFALTTILEQRLGDTAGGTDRPRHFSYAPVIEELRLVLTAMALAGAADEASFRTAFERAMGSFVRPGDAIPARRVPPQALKRALTELRALSLLLKGPVLTACADCVVHDGKVEPQEAELLRATALSLGCPMPPLLDPAMDPR